MFSLISLISSCLLWIGHFRIIAMEQLAFGSGGGACRHAFLWQSARPPSSESFQAVWLALILSIAPGGFAMFFLGPLCTSQQLLDVHGYVMKLDWNNKFDAMIFQWYLTPSLDCFVQSRWRNLKQFYLESLELVTAVNPSGETRKRPASTMAGQLLEKS